MSRRSAGNSLIKNCDVHPSAGIAPSKIGAGALPAGVSLTDSIPLSQLPNLARVVGISTIPAKSATKVAGALAGNSATNAFTIETDPIDVPRNLEVVFDASWDGGNVVVTGTNQWGAAQTETFTGGSEVTRVGSKVFATVVSAAKTAVGAAAAGATIGTGAKLGIGVDLSDSSGVCFTATSFDAAAVFDSTNDAFTPSVEPNDDTYTLIVNV